MDSSRVELAAGATVFREGDPPTTAFLIESGEIEILAGGDDSLIVLALLHAGDLLGEMAVIDASPRTATARAVTPCVLMTIGAEQLHERIEHADPVVRSLLRGLLQRYRSALATLRGGDPASPATTSSGDDVATESTDAVDKIRLEAQLKETLARRALEVRFQPILEIATGRIAGFEALIRWQHPERGAISPAEFIRLAEETSLIVPVGLYVFEEVCAALAGLRRDGVELPWVAINVSARQIDEDGLLENVQQIAATNQVPLSAIKIEVTESLTLNIERVGALIGRCHAMGMKVALDDFGTGFSNLGHLHKLRFDTVKLDQGFVRQMLDAPRCHAIVRAIVRMVDELDADLVAEGVETQAQLDALATLGCRYAQGYLLGKPGGAGEMAATLARKF